MSFTPTFPAPISEAIWEAKYRLKVPDGVGGAGLEADRNLAATFERVANAVAAAEGGGKRSRKAWSGRFYDAIADFGFLPAGRILAGAGSRRDVTLFNCFVMGRIDDDLASIFDNLKDAALTMQQGGGIGQDFSTLRPAGALVRSIGADASGPVSFMDVWDAMCATIRSAGARRGAMMATMRCDHPDIETFIAAKSDPRRLRNFNLSVLVTDAFMQAVTADAAWPLKFEGRIYREVSARSLWDKIMRATYEYAEPGVIFIDRVNATNNLAYVETISATNPCGEQPLPPYGACLLGSINLTRFVKRPFCVDAALDVAALEERVQVAVRFLDNVIDVSRFPLPAQRHEARTKRRIGLGITGLADALAMVGQRYGSEAAAQQAAHWMAALSRAAYLASSELAREKGAFALFDRDRFLQAPHVAAHDKDVRRAIARYGIRNGCLTSIAPTGTISLFAGNVSSGIEPIFELWTKRRILDAHGRTQEVVLDDYAVRLFRLQHGEDAALPEVFVTASQLTPHEHMRMQAALQPYVDSSISKTINCPADLPFSDFADIYREAYASGVKGCTTFRPNAITGAVLKAAETPDSNRSSATARAVSTIEEAAKGSEAQALRNRTSPTSVVTTWTQASDPKHAASISSPVVYLAKPIERPVALSGSTYKVVWPGSDHALYVTINDIEVEGSEGASGPRRRPFEIFINTRNLEHYAWTVALTRMISAVFRRGGDVSFVAEELKAVFDPQGGQWIAGRYVPSLLAAIGDVVETHMRHMGALSPGHDGSGRAGTLEHARADNRGAKLSPPESGRNVMPVSGTHAVSGRICPKCRARAFVRQEGCWICTECGFSRCG
jgi:ribonucleoside-diphosphate reductase alpha chain